MSTRRNTSSHGAVALYDGDCGFCRNAVHFAQHHDPRGRLRFIASQSTEGRTLMARHNLPADQPGSLVLIEGDRLAVGSTAILRICHCFSDAWSLLYLAIVVPRPLRDRLYALVARHRDRLALSL